MALILLEECNALLARCAVYTRVTDGIYKLCVLITKLQITV